MNKKIFIAFPSFNEDDVERTITTALSNARHPELVNFGILLHYPKGNYPDVYAYPNVRYVKSDYPIGLGTGPSRKIAASLHEDEEYYLQIDAHTIFKKDWDHILMSRYKELKKIWYRPIITSFANSWHKDEAGNIINKEGTTEIKDFKPDSMAFKKIDDDLFANTSLPTPRPIASPYKNFYEEHFLISAHFLFTESRYLEEIPFDTKIKYHEENTTALRAWTRGYRFFAISDDVLWTREMMTRVEPEDSWRKMLDVQDRDGKSFNLLALQGLIRCKDILSGKIIGKYGAVDNEGLAAYEDAAGINYKSFYEKMDAFSKMPENKNTRAGQLAELEDYDNYY